MKLEITLGPDARVDARTDGKLIATDQDGALPEPFELFLASIGTCAGSYVERFCRKRDLPTDGIRIVQTTSDPDPKTRLIDRIDIDVELPPGFPERYRSAVVRAANLCTVKKHLSHPPSIEVTTSKR
jgi:ribosomal protein S12 methylthiotransferase accessory factor